MKRLLIIAVIFLFNIFISAQSKKIIIDEKSGKSMLIGITNLSDFQDTAFAGWWNTEYKDYMPDSVTIENLKGKLDSLKITIVMATWCSDSRREVPRFYKLLDILKYPVEKINLICVDRKKKGIGTEADNLKIELVPTFIFYSNDKETGRIIESPKECLEKDLFTFIKE